MLMVKHNEAPDFLDANHEDRAKLDLPRGYDAEHVNPVTFEPGPMYRISCPGDRDYQMS